jgi:hypothetical protein
MRTLWSWLLALALALPSLLALVPAAIQAQAQAVEHALLHDEGLGHRHAAADDHDVASIDLAISSAHQHHDGGHVHALPSGLLNTHLAFGRPPMPERRALTVLPNPFIEGPLRPPRALL